MPYDQEKIAIVDSNTKCKQRRLPSKTIRDIQMDVCLVYQLIFILRIFLPYPSPA